MFQRNTNFDQFFIGFEDMMKRSQAFIESASKSFNTYPPFNIKKVDDSKYVIEIAVAGFGKHDLEIEAAGSTLKISGKSDYNSGEEEKSYLHKGIASREFERKFQMADTIEIKNAELVNGMLKVYLENIIPDHKKPRKVDIDVKAEDDTEVKKKNSWLGVKSSESQLLTEESKQAV